MKVPYLKKRVNDEFDGYLNELEQGVHSAIAEARGRKDAGELFSTLFPFFVLLRGLQNSEYARNPARDSALTELRDAGRKYDFIEALTYFRVHHPYQREMSAGFQRQTFAGYFDEIFSDALMLLNSFYTCNYRGSFIALRCMLEDLYRHLYYRDHPQEFRTLQQGGDERALKITPQSLRDYLPGTDYLGEFRLLSKDFLKKQDSETKDLFHVNDELYRTCSRSVHGSAGATLNAFSSNADISFSGLRADEVVHAVREFVGMSIAFLVAAHLDQFLGFSDYERSMVLDGFAPGRRAALRAFLNI